MKLYPRFVFIHLLLLENSKNFKAPTRCSVTFSKAFTKAEYENLVCSIICILLEGSIFLPVRYSYANIYTAYLLVSYCSFTSLILSSNVMISFYILSKRFFLKCEGLSNARLTPITKKEYGFAAHF